MSAIIWPQSDEKAKESWKAWRPCHHNTNESNETSGSTQQHAELASASKPSTSHEPDANANGTFDQGASGDQCFAEISPIKDAVENSNEVIAEDAVSKDSPECADPETQFEPDSRLMSSSEVDRNATGSNLRECPFSADEDGPLAPLETLSSEQESTETGTGKNLKDKCFDTVNGDVVFNCPECKKLQQEEQLWTGSERKPFMNKIKSSCKFVWNKYLLQGFERLVHPDWILHVVNGFVGQCGILKHGFFKHQGWHILISTDIQTH